MQLGQILSVSLSMCGGGDWGVEMREERSCKTEERVENYPQSLKNEWKINGCRVLVSTQIPQFWDTERRGGDSEGGGRVEAGGERGK